jgi:hypothetical protein
MKNRVLQELNVLIIKVMAYCPDGSPIEWHNDYGVLAREKCKIIWIDWGTVQVNGNDVLWELIKEHYVFPSEHEERGKRATILAIGRNLRRFRHALNKLYIQPSVSPFHQFGFITPNE